jgi:hypothetical protein
MSDDEPESVPFARAARPSARIAPRRQVDRVQGALQGTINEIDLTEDEWDWFAALRDDSSRHQRAWRLRVSEPRAACLSAPARRRLAAILEHLEWMPHLIVHTVAGRLRVSRQFNTKMDREVHWFMVEHVRWTVSGESTEDRVSRHLAAFFRISPRVLAVEFPETTEDRGSLATNACALIAP